MGVPFTEIGRRGGGGLGNENPKNIFLKCKFKLFIRNSSRDVKLHRQSDVDSQSSREKSRLETQI